MLLLALFCFPLGYCLIVVSSRQQFKEQMTQSQENQYREGLQEERRVRREMRERLRTLQEPDRNLSDEEIPVWPSRPQGGTH